MLRLLLQISQLEFFNAVQSVKQSMGSSFYTTPVQCLGLRSWHAAPQVSELRLEVVAKATNWLDQSDQACGHRVMPFHHLQASVLVTLETLEEPMPIVSPTSATSLTVANSLLVAVGSAPRASGEQVAFSVETRYVAGPQAPLPSS